MDGGHIGYIYSSARTDRWISSHLYRVADTGGGYCISAASSSLHALRDDMRGSYLDSPGLPHPLGSIHHGPANVPDSHSGMFRVYGWVFGFWHVVEVELLLYIYNFRL